MDIVYGSLQLMKKVRYHSIYILVVFRSYFSEVQDEAG